MHRLNKFKIFVTGFYFTKTSIKVQSSVEEVNCEKFSIGGKFVVFCTRTAKVFCYGVERDEISEEPFEISKNIKCFD